MLYDSMKGEESHDIEVQKIVELIVSFLSHVVDGMGIFDAMLDIEKGTRPFQLNICDEFPQ